MTTSKPPAPKGKSQFKGASTKSSSDLDQTAAEYSPLQHMKEVSKSRQPELRVSEHDVVIEWTTHYSLPKLADRFFSSDQYKAMDFLEREDVSEAIEVHAERKALLYERVPKHFYLEKILVMVDNAMNNSEMRATEKQAILTGFLNWFKDVPMPSNIKKVKQMLAVLQGGQDDG